MRNVAATPTNRHRIVATVTILLSVLLGSTAAHAAANDNPNIRREGDVGGKTDSPPLWSLTAIFPAPGVPMFVTTMHIAKRAFRGERPTASWLFTSYALSGVGLASAIGIVTTAGTSEISNFGIGLGVAAVSLFNAAITIYGHTRPAGTERAEKGLGIVPIMGRAADGGMFAGLGVQLFGF